MLGGGEAVDEDDALCKQGPRGASLLFSFLWGCLCKSVGSTVLDVSGGACACLYVLSLIWNALALSLNFFFPWRHATIPVTPIVYFCGTGQTDGAAEAPLLSRSTATMCTQAGRQAHRHIGTRVTYVVNECHDKSHHVWPPSGTAKVGAPHDRRVSTLIPSPGCARNHMRTRHTPPPGLAAAAPPSPRIRGAEGQRIYSSTHTHH